MGEGGYRTKFRMRAACERVTGFRFDKPAGYSFSPGQYLRLTLTTSEGEQSRDFSLASSPGDPFLEIATRMSGSAFKNALGDLVRGDEVAFDGPYGGLVLGEGITRACFLAGGVGIAPARSIIRDAEQHRSGLRIRLFYGNHDQACIPYSGEFAEYARKDRRFQVVHVLEDPLPGWTGESGLITAPMLRSNLDGDDGWHFYVTGPPAMVTAMDDELSEMSVPPERITIEKFSGY